MANKIIKTIKSTTIYYKIYGDDSKDVEAISIPGILADDAMWKEVKKLAGPKAVVWDY